MESVTRCKGSRNQTFNGPVERQGAQLPAGVRQEPVSDLLSLSLPVYTLAAAVKASVTLAMLFNYSLFSQLPV